MFLTEAELTYKCGILLNIGDVMGVQGPYIDNVKLLQDLIKNVPCLCS